MAEEEFGILLVGEAVRRDVLRLEADRFLQCKFPLLDGLTWQSEHEIDTDV